MLATIVRDISLAVQQSMLGVVGIIALLIWLKKPWLAGLVGVIVFTPVALSGMFPPGSPWLDIAMGLGIITVFVTTILRLGLLATASALATHFLLLRAPITLQLSSWRAPAGLWFLGTIAVAGFGAVYIARHNPHVVTTART